MIESAKKWTITKPDQNAVDRLIQELGLSSMHAKVLVSRGITDSQEAKDFLHMDTDSIHDPYLFYEMTKAVELIKQTIADQKAIVVYGDYDADGVTSVSVLMTTLLRMGANVTFSIPDRFEHGYGPNKALFKEIHDQGASLIITVDNGISGIDEVSYAKELGLNVIITDHHEIGSVIPSADVVLHPRHPSGSYPFGDLAGVGVAFKLASALLDEPPLDLLELVAIGTVADLVSLRGENRYFVKEGIKRLRTTKRPAIRALARIASTEQSQLNEESIGFMIGPRLNAAGRLGSAAPAVELLMADDEDLAKMLASDLDSLNKERQAIVALINDEVAIQIQKMYGDTVPNVFVIAAEGWNAGVVGIVASRITEKYHRPTIILSIDPETQLAKGSARSIEGFDLYAELSKNAHILPHYGGHQMAAGMTLALSDVGELRTNLNEQAELVLTPELLLPKLTIDVPLTIDEIDVSVLESLELLRPFGMDFQKPMYLVEDLTVETVRKIGAAKNHLKLELLEGATSLDAIGFGMGYIADDLTPALKVSVAGDLQVNEWNGNKKPQMLITDLKSDEWQLFDLRGMREPSRWLPSIPLEKTLFFAFQQQTIAHFTPLLKGVNISLFSEIVPADCSSIVLLDIPDDETILATLLEATKPSRVYAHFYAAESKYFDGMPSREQFGWYFSFLKKREKFDLSTNANKLTSHKGWKKDTIYFMTKVFSELGFVTIEGGFISVAETVGKKELSDAPSFKEREHQIELEKILLYAPYMELKRWFETLMNMTVTREEH